jgi:hypothetical protein
MNERFRGPMLTALSVTIGLSVFMVMTLILLWLTESGCLK